MSVKVIAYDVGTTGLKTCLFSISAAARVQYLAGEVEHYALHVLDNGGVEQDAADWWDAMARSTDGCWREQALPEKRSGELPSAPSFRRWCWWIRPAGPCAGL